MHKFIVLFFITQCFFACVQRNTIPKGSIKGPFQWQSKIYPGTERNYWVYVPKDYNAAKPACLMVVQDGLACANSWRLPVVLDSMIAAKEIPVMIGLFIDHGTVPSADTSSFPRFNRSLEYDALGNRYARFLLDELIPELSRSYNLSTDPNDRCIAGSSSGAICAFNAAWERPNAFRRVLSSIGTYVGLRGGHEFPTLIRKTEAKPIRVFLEDGTRDNNIYAGDWWVANQDMLSALTWAGYEVNHAWSEGGGHNNRHTAAILPDALKWLWKDYPDPVQTHTDSVVRTNVLLKNQAWEEIPLKTIEAEKLAVNRSGELFLKSGQSVYKSDDKNNITLFATITGKLGGMSFHYDDKLYIGDLTKHKIISIAQNGAKEDIVRNVDADFMTISNKGIYFTDRIKKGIGFYSFANKQVQYSVVAGTPAGLAICAEQTFINLGFDDLQFGYSFKIMEDGTLGYGQEYIYYHLPYGENSPRISGLVTDTANLLYSATNLGIQMSDQLGRVNFIIAKPADTITDIKIGGAGFNLLYASCDGRLFRRKLNTKGILPWLSAVKPSKPRM